MSFALNYPRKLRVDGFWTAIFVLTFACARRLDGYAEFCCSTNIRAFCMELASRLLKTIGLLIRLIA
jgi:hypothetical protein